MFSQRLEHFIMLGKAPSLVLREHHRLVCDNVENPIRALDELCINTESILDRGRQTGGLR